jgi:hypothetical protein
MSQVDLLRIRVGAAESNWKEARERAGQAKRRKKLAKLMAKRAQKDAKRAKVRLAETREALAHAEAVAITIRRRAPRAKIRPAPLKRRRSAVPRIAKAARASSLLSVIPEQSAPVGTSPSNVESEKTDL